MKTNPHPLLVLALALTAFLAGPAPAQPAAPPPAGGPEEPIRYAGHEVVDGSHEGGLRLDPVQSLERISFRTGPFRSSPSLRDPKTPGEDILGASERETEAGYYIDDVSVTPGPW